MIRISSRICRRAAVMGTVLLASLVLGCNGHTQVQVDNDSLKAPPSARDIDLNDHARDLGAPPSKLSPALQRLANGSEASRDLPSPDQQPSDLPSPSEIGYPVPGTDIYQVAIHITPEADIKAIKAAGATIQMRLGNTLYASVHAPHLAEVADVDGVLSINPMPAGQIPTPPKSNFQTTSQSETARDIDLTGNPGTGDSIKFDHHNFTGKGVIVGIIDTGIDWRHPDFIKPDGTSRILYLWDVFDDTWEKSNHTIGSAPPMNSDDNKPLGTVYTQEQLNAALNGQQKIGRRDVVGHGTACAGTAAGNNLGVAPDADLVIVDTWIDDKDQPGNDGACGVQGADWIRKIAAKRNQPCVMNLSFGGHDSPHDGTGDQESGFNEVQDNGEAKGVVICASAGNNGQDSMHARSRFGPAGETELVNGFCDPIQLFVSHDAIIGALFDSRDDFYFRIAGTDKFLVGTNGKAAWVDMFKSEDKNASGDGLQLSGSDNLSPADVAKFKSLRHDQKIALKSMNGGSDALIMDLPPGSYDILVAGRSKHVTRGVFDLYALDSANAAFGGGGDHNMVIGSPGDADDVITVGSYDFRNQWDNQQGTITHSGKVDLGNISGYSSEGYRRDGAIKPDIAAPGQYTISALAPGCMMAEEMGGPVAITKDGKHVAWAGTSASCPYTVGVVALMLQANPQLTCNQVKQILRDTADHDMEVTGAVPNSVWGYGKLNPEKAIKKVMDTAGSAPPSTQPSPSPEPSPFTNPDQKSSIAGTFKGDGIVLTLVANADGSFSGSMIRSDKNFPVAAKFVAGQIEGNVTNNGQDFPFTATLNGDTLTLHANDKTYTLLRQGLARGLDAGWLEQAMSPSPDNAGASRDIGGSSLAFKPVEIDDPMINNWPAFKLLIPNGWQFQGEIHWNEDPFTMVSAVVLAHAPGGLPGVLIYPQGSYIDGIRQQRMQMFAGVGGSEYMEQAYAEGKLYFGKEIRTFIRPDDYVKNFIIHLYRKDLAQAQVVSVEDAPKFAKMIGDMGQIEGLQGARSDAVKVKFQYQLKGRPVEEDMYCAIVAIPLPGNLVSWTGNTLSFVAPQGEMDRCTPVLTTIVSSLKPQLKWLNACLQVSEMMHQNYMKQIEMEGQLSRYIAQVSDEISDMNRQAYEHQCQVEDHVAQEWHEYIMSITPYNTPSGPVELPNTGSWWMDPSGCYHQVMPGEAPERNWTQLEPAQG